MNKELCKKCISCADVPWGDDDDKAWEEGGLLFCVDDLCSDIGANVRTPNCCPFVLEHCVFDPVNVFDDPPPQNCVQKVLAKVKSTLQLSITIRNY